MIESVKRKKKVNREVVEVCGSKWKYAVERQLKASKNLLTKQFNLYRVSFRTLKTK